MNDRPLAVFDLDGTLVRGDTLLPFLFGYHQRFQRWAKLGGTLFDLALYALRMRGAKSTKERLVGRFLGGEPIDRVTAYANRFCQEWVATRVHREVLQTLRTHQQAGHRVVLVSASPNLYVPTIAHWFGISEVVCTRFLVADGRIGNAMEGPNCKGQSKVEMLTEYLRTETAPLESFGYGDAASDAPILSWVRHGYWVRRATHQPLIPFRRQS